MFTHFPVTSSQFHFSRWRLLLPSLPLISTLRARPHLGRRVFGAANTNDSALFSGSGNIVTGQIKTDSNSKLRNHKAFLKAGAPLGVIHDTNFAHFNFLKQNKKINKYQAADFRLYSSWMWAEHPASTWRWRRQNIAVITMFAFFFFRIQCRRLTCTMDFTHPSYLQMVAVPTENSFPVSGSTPGPTTLTKRGRYITLR